MLMHISKVTSYTETRIIIVKYKAIIINIDCLPISLCICQLIFSTSWKPLKHNNPDG